MVILHTIIMNLSIVVSKLPTSSTKSSNTTILKGHTIIMKFPTIAASFRINSTKLYFLYY
jgi:hypothetical protein